MSWPLILSCGMVMISHFPISLGETCGRCNKLFLDGADLFPPVLNPYRGGGPLLIPSYLVKIDLLHPPCGNTRYGRGSLDLYRPLCRHSHVLDEFVRLL